MNNTPELTGEKLYEEMVAAATAAGKSVEAFAEGLYDRRQVGWKLEQLRISRFPQRHTIERVRALCAGEPIPEIPDRKKGTYDPRLQRTKRADREALGLPASRREIMEAELARKANERRARIEHTRHLTSLAHQSRRPGQTLHARLCELQREFAA